MIHIPTDPRLFLIEWICNFLMVCGLCLPVYFVFRQAKQGLLIGAITFWFFITAGLFLLESVGEDMDMAPGWYLIGGWLVGLLYCLPPLAVITVWRARCPNPDGYCRKCGRAIKADQTRCPVGHSLSDISRGFEVKL